MCLPCWKHLNWAASLRITAHGSCYPSPRNLFCFIMETQILLPKSFNKLLSSGTDNQHINMDIYFPSSAALSLSFVLIWACDLHAESLKAHQMWCGLAPFSSLHKQFRTPRKVFFLFFWILVHISLSHSWSKPEKWVAYSQIIEQSLAL